MVFEVVKYVFFRVSNASALRNLFEALTMVDIFFFTGFRSPSPYYQIIYIKKLTVVENDNNVCILLVNELWSPPPPDSVVFQWWWW